MCGRFASTQTDADLVRAFRVEEVVGEQLAPSYNVAPTQPVRAVLERTPREEPEAPPIRQIRTVRWGLIPSWARDRKVGSRLINARAETITEKPSFKAAASRRRCIVPADGYFEWERRDGAKVPHYLHGDGVLGMAGLYELWPDPEREPDDPQRWVWTITVLTTTASDALGHIHDRSPVVIPPALQDAWLDTTLTDSERIRELLGSVPEPRLQPYEVSTAVNSVRNNSAELLSPV